MGSKMNSFEEKVKLPLTESIFDQPQRNHFIRIITVAVYVLCVSLAAIMLSLYYIFIWDPTLKPPPFLPKVVNCDKIIIPENIAIRLLNSSELSAEQFYKNIFRHYQMEQNKLHSAEVKSSTMRNEEINELSMRRTLIPKYTKKLSNLRISDDDDEEDDDAYDEGNFDGSGYKTNNDRNLNRFS